MSVDTKPQTESQALFHDLDKPSLHALSYALRHPDTWPEGFVWDFSQCEQCAMGLAHYLWRQLPIPDNLTGPTYMAREFAMPFSIAKDIFLANPGLWAPTKKGHKGMLWWKKSCLKSDFDAITPEMVADQIDKYLKTAE